MDHKITLNSPLKEATYLRGLWIESKAERPVVNKTRLVKENRNPVTSTISRVNGRTQVDLQDRSIIDEWYGKTCDMKPYYKV